MRVVLDTNVLISALFWNGNERELLLACKKRKHQLIVSPGIIEELDRVLTENFHLPQGKITEYIQNILFISEIVFPTGKTNVVKDDPSDNIIIETALLGKAKAIVTGDQHLLKLQEHKGIKITQASKL